MLQTGKLIKDSEYLLKLIFIFIKNNYCLIILADKKNIRSGAWTSPNFFHCYLSERAWAHNVLLASLRESCCKLIGRSNSIFPALFDQSWIHLINFCGDFLATDSPFFTSSCHFVVYSWFLWRYLDLNIWFLAEAFPFFSDIPSNYVVISWLQTTFLLHCMATVSGTKKSLCLQF